MKRIIREAGIALAVLMAIGLAVEVAQAAPVTVRVPMPTALSDGATLLAADRVGAAVYCGPTAGRYVQQWFVAGVTDTIEVQADVSGRVFCAATAFATVAGSVRESDYSVEFALNPTAPVSPRGTTVQWQTPMMCATVCTVDRRR